MHMTRPIGSWRTRVTVAIRPLCVAVFLVLCLALALPADALGAGEDVWDAVAITVHNLDKDQEPTLVISSLAREGSELPVQAAIAIPKGAEVSWVGEILGGDPTADPQLEATVDTGVEYDVVRFTLTRSLRAQIEMAVPQDWITTTDDGRHIGIEWTSAGLVDRARVGITLPLTYHLEDVSPPTSVKIQPSDVFYSVETSPVAMGQTIALSGIIVDGMAPELTEMMARGDEGSAGSTSDTGSVDIQPIRASNMTAEDEGIGTVWIIAVALGAIVAILLVIVISRSRSGELP